MKKIIQCIGAAVYGSVVGYLLWLLFYWMTPYIMGVGWLLFILYLIFASGLITGLVYAATMLLSFPTSLILKGNTAAKIINAIPLLFYGYCSVKLPWGLRMDYGALQYLIAISLSITFLIAFAATIFVPFNLPDKDED